ncbi:uncharacterized protein [Argopecten irradians]|uniref:uncharacterized protein n=1 Tax=Argopecten irradians TaxID=31199 RepID=UPI003712768E
MIDELISNLDSSLLGLHIHDIHIPSVFLADDTLLLSCSVGNIQRLLDIVFEFSCKWRLNYNSTKSSLLRFCNSRKKFTPEIQCKLGDQKIAWVTQKEYAGIILTPTLQCDEDIKRSCAKGRRSLNSLISVGIHDGGMNPITSSKLVETIVQPVILYGSELWGAPTLKSQEDLRKTQRYAARRCQGFEKTSPTLATTRALGMLDICGEVEQKKLIFWNKLCSASSVFVWKLLFIVRLCAFAFGKKSLNEKSFVFDIFAIASKFDITDSLFDYIFEGFQPSRFSWKSFCKNVVQSFYQTKWLGEIVHLESFQIYASVHQNYGPNPLWTLALKYPNYTWQLSEMIKLSYRHEKEPVLCKLCNKLTDNITVHFLIQCYCLFETRDKMLEFLVNYLDVYEYVKFDNLEDHEKCFFLLGSKQDILLDDERWPVVMITVSDFIHRMIQDMNCLIDL